MNEVDRQAQEASSKFGDSAKLGFFARGRELESVTTNHYYTEIERMRSHIKLRTKIQSENIIPLPNPGRLIFPLLANQKTPFMCSKNPVSEDLSKAFRDYYLLIILLAYLHNSLCSETLIRYRNSHFLNESFIITNGKISYSLFYKIKLSTSNKGKISLLLRC